MGSPEIEATETSLRSVSAPKRSGPRAVALRSPAMRWLVVAAVLAGCSRRKESTPAPVVEDVTPLGAEVIAPAKPTVGDAVAREAGMPPRTACATTCSHPAGDCNRIEGSVFVEAEWDHHVGCYVRTVRIDCCPALPADDAAGIATALGWQRASTEERVAIAWFIARVVQGRSILAKVPEPFGELPTFTAPTVTSQAPVVLDFWWWPHDVRRRRLVHEQLRFSDDGVPTAVPVVEIEAGGLGPAAR